MSKIQLKAHGAWLGGGTGVGVASLIVGLLQQHVTHHPLAQVDVQAVYSLVAVAGSFLGAYVLPTLQRVVPPAQAPAGQQPVATTLPPSMPAAPAPPPAPVA